MIISVKEAKLRKVDPNFWRVISVSQKALDDEKIFNCTELLPDQESWLSFTSGKLSKKKFLKKYKKLLQEKNTYVEYTIFTIGMSLKNKQNICVTARDEEYRSGYVKVLCEYLAELFGVEYSSIDEAKESIDEELSEYTKKERKILKTPDEELSKKKLKLKEKLTKHVKKSIRGDMENTDVYDHMDKKFAIDQLVMVYVNQGNIKLDKKTNTFKDIHTEGLENLKPLIKAILIASEESKPIRKIAKSVFESHDLKFKEKTMKKMDMESLFALAGEIYGKICQLRLGYSGDGE